MIYNCRKDQSIFENGIKEGYSRAYAYTGGKRYIDIHSNSLNEVCRTFEQHISEKLNKQDSDACSEAYEEGYSKGHEEGYDEGYEDGLLEGEHKNSPENVYFTLLNSFLDQARFLGFIVTQDGGKVKISNKNVSFVFNEEDITKLEYFLLGWEKCLTQK